MAPLLQTFRPKPRGSARGVGFRWAFCSGSLLQIGVPLGFPGNQREKKHQRRHVPNFTSHLDGSAVAKKKAWENFPEKPSGRSWKSGFRNVCLSLQSPRKNVEIQGSLFRPFEPLPDLNPSWPT